MKQEVVKEIENVLSGKSGNMNINMVDDNFSIQMTGTFNGQFKLLMYGILAVAKQNNMSYLELISELESLVYPDTY